MAKRKLSKQQQVRIKEQQESRIQRASSNKTRTDDSDPLGPEQEGLIIANFGARLLLEDDKGEIFRCIPRSNLPLLVTGDRVIWQQQNKKTGVIGAAKERTSLLARPDAQNIVKPLAANIDQLLIVFSPLPALSTELIDRYLITAESLKIEPILILNKTDLLDERSKEELESKLSIYRQLGYKMLYTSTKIEHGLDTLFGSLKDKISVFVGQSGVGKSSLIKSILPDKEIPIGEISEASGLGKHTTSVTYLYHIKTGGKLIDSPGVRDFLLHDIDIGQLESSFPEFREYLGQCKFRNCRHKNEPGCAILAALNKNLIHPKRLQNFHKIMYSLENKLK